MKFLARSHWLRTEQQARMVAAIAERLRSAGLVFVWGEDARLAAALSAVARRTDSDPVAFVSWFRRLQDEHVRSGLDVSTPRATWRSERN